MENKEEDINLTNDTEETVNDTEDIEETSDDSEDESEDVEILKKKILSLQKQKEHWRSKAEKTDKSEKEEVKESKKSHNPILSALDLIAIQKAGISEADELEEVTNYAKYKNISIAEALKSSVVKSTLKEMQEYKKTAEASNTAKSARGTSKVSDDSLLANARKGVLPESEEDMKRLANLRLKK